jgi:hypothetical protein
MNLRKNKVVALLLTLELKNAEDGFTRCHSMAYTGINTLAAPLSRKGHAHYGRVFLRLSILLVTQLAPMLGRYSRIRGTRKWLRT